MSKNVIWWTAIVNPNHTEKYGGFGYFEYSKKAWEYWCKKNDCIFVDLTEPVEKDLNQFRPNWQKAIFVFDELERRNIDYNKIALVDSTAIPHWDCPNFFDLTDDRFTSWRDMDNMKWVYDSIKGYESFFEYKLDNSKYVNSGVIIFNKSHRRFFESFKELYYNNSDAFIELQDIHVKKGTEQTPFNYWIQKNNIELNLDMPVTWKLTHLHRREMFSYNWQLDEDKTPFFLKYGYVWRFNGIPKDQRTQIMGELWKAIGGQYV